MIVVSANSSTAVAILTRHPLLLFPSANAQTLLCWGPRACPLPTCCAHPRVRVGVHGPLVGFQARLESSSRRKSSDDIIADSPYAAGGSNNTSRNNHSSNHSNSNGGSSSSGSSNAAWKHKHTKTLPWGEEGAIGVGGGGDGGGGDRGGGSGTPNAGRQEGGFGREPSVDRSAEERTERGRGGRAREGYRLQVWWYVVCVYRKIVAG